MMFYYTLWKLIPPHTQKRLPQRFNKNKMKIIREKKQPILLVNGIAGSGKTSVIMQRIAYLLYQNRQIITADNILLLSPNSTFIDYISQVLPNLGERNPRNLTLLQFLRFTNQTFLPLESKAEFFSRIIQTTATEQETILRSFDFVDFLKKQQSVNLSASLFQDIMYKKQRLFTAEPIFSLYCQTPSELPVRKRLAATKEKLTHL